MLPKGNEGFRFRYYKRRGPGRLGRVETGLLSRTPPSGAKRDYLGARANLHTDLQMNRIRNISVFAQYFRQIILLSWIHF